MTAVCLYLSAMNAIIDNAIADLANGLRRSFNEAFKAKLIKSLTEVVPGFDPADLSRYASRVTVATVEGQALKEVHFDMADTYNSGTFLFYYSDELKVDFSGGHFKATIG